MRKPKLLFSAPHLFFPQELKASLSAHFDVHYLYGHPFKEQLESLKTAQVWVVSTAPERFLGPKVIDVAAKLEVLATPSTGWTHLDKDYIESKGLTFLSIRGAETIDSIKASSEHTFALVMTLLRKFPTAVNEVREKRWRENEALLRGRELEGKTLGVIGYGRIGRNVSRYANAFEMNVLAYDPYVTDYAEYVTSTSLDALLAGSDIVCLCVHLSEETKGFFDAGKFSKMKKGGFFINTARGELVDESVLLESLRDGMLAGAAVDVIADEQGLDFSDNSVIRYSYEHDNLIITPHVAGLTEESETKAARDVVRQILDYYQFK